MDKETKKQDGKYLDIFFSFLKIEIPNLVQIVTLLGFFGAALDRDIYKVILLISVYFLTVEYISEKYYYFLQKQASEDKSLLNTYSLSYTKLSKTHDKYVFMASVILIILIAVISYTLDFPLFSF